MPPGNDNRASATQVQFNDPVDGDNIGAGVEGGEPTTCGAAPYGKTVWYRVPVGVHGTARFLAQGFDAVIAVYAGGSGSPIACGDDTGGSTGGFVQAYLPPGEYFVQVGGYGSGAGAAEGTLTFTALFEIDFDVDRDGHSRPGDCNDSNPAVHPGAPDVNNGINDDCAGLTDPDLDSDGLQTPT